MSYLWKNRFARAYVIDLHSGFFYDANKLSRFTATYKFYLDFRALIGQCWKCNGADQKSAGASKLQKCMLVFSAFILFFLVLL